MPARSPRWPVSPGRMSRSSPRSSRRISAISAASRRSPTRRPRILRGLEPGGVAVLPADSPLLPRLRAAAGDARVVTFGSSAGADGAADADRSGCRRQRRHRRDRRPATLRFRLNAPGRHMAMNALAALAAGAATAASTRDAAVAALAGLRPVAGRGAAPPHRRAAAAPRCCWTRATTPTAPRCAPRSPCCALQPATRRIAVLGDMLELGDAGPAEHAALAAGRRRGGRPAVRLRPADAPPVRRAARRAARRASPRSAGARADRGRRASQPGDAVLVKGSLGSRMKLVVQRARRAGAADRAEAA